MASSTETGHAINIANLEALNQIIVGYGTGYAPTNPLLKKPAMVAQYIACDALQGTVNTVTGVFFPIRNARKDEFKTVKPLARKVRQAAKACGASKSFNVNVNTVVMKLLGERATPPTPTPTDPSGTSASQQGFDNTVNNFDKLVGILSGEPLYAPNETPLKVATLAGEKIVLNNKNNAVKTGVTPYNNAVIARNKALYANTTGLCDVGQLSKSYIRSVYGYSSPEFRLVSKIKFKKTVKVD